MVSATHSITDDFTALYCDLRQKEGRMYTDAEVAELPSISPSHPHYREWQLRKHSFTRLIAYLRKKNTALHILEAGCGNGWLARHLANIPGSRVTALDINSVELEQAQRVFGYIESLQFVNGTIYSETVTKSSFDIIVLAACIQYFPSLTGTIRHLFTLLKPAGEIHILDSPFYRFGKVTAAKERTASYYRDMGLPGMIKYYFHHEETDLEGLNYDVLYRPSFFNAVFLQNKNPFSWLRIKKSANSE